MPLDDRGRRQAEALGPLLKSMEEGRGFAKVLVSPLQRAIETGKLAGYGDIADVRPDLAEWDYGDYDGRTTPQILSERPGWTLWGDGVPNGETVQEVGQRVDRVIAEVRSTPGDVALFAHGHVLRILTARWLGQAPSGGQLYALDPGGVSALGYEHTWAVIAHWNQMPPRPGG